MSHRHDNRLLKILLFIIKYKNKLMMWWWSVDHTKGLLGLSFSEYSRDNKPLCENYMMSHLFHLFTKILLFWYQTIPETNFKLLYWHVWNFGVKLMHYLFIPTTTTLIDTLTQQSNGSSISRPNRTLAGLWPRVLLMDDL